MKLHILNLKIAVGAKLMRWGLWGRNAPPKRWVKWHEDLCAFAPRSHSGDEVA